MLTLKELTQRYSRPGRVERIFLRPERRAAPVSVAEGELLEGGLLGDHGRPGKRAVTLLQAEHVPVIASLAGLDELDPALLRRNIVVSGLNLQAMRGARLSLGSEAQVLVTGPCAPCSRMEEALGHGAYTAMRGHGGWCASLAAPGRISIGDAVVPMHEGTTSSP